MKPFTIDLQQIFSPFCKRGSSVGIDGSGKSLSLKRVLIKGVSTDTRTLKAEDWFIAIKGKNFNGVDFLDKAITKGAAGVIVNDDDFKKIETKKTYPIPIVKVPEEVAAYGLLAKAYLDYITSGHAHRRIAITGSAGKTSCKDFLSTMLSSEFKVFTSRKNFNNHLGVPSNVFAIDGLYDFYIFELAMNHAGEIDYLSSLIKPHITMITNILPAHIGFFDCLEQIALAKAEIFNHQLSEGKVYLPQTEPFFSLLKEKAEDKKLHIKAIDVNLFSIKSELRLEEGIHHYLKTKSLPLKALNGTPIECAGGHHASNLSLCGQVALDLKLTLPSLKKAISSLKTTESRFEIVCESPLIIDDSYNANPASMIEAIRCCVELRGENAFSKLFVVLGDIFELGEKREFYHQEIGEKIAILTENSSKVSFIFIGQAMQVAYKTLKDSKVDGVETMHFQDKQAALNYLQKKVDINGFYFFKASNGMQFKQLINDFKCSIT